MVYYKVLARMRRHTVLMLADAPLKLLFAGRLAEIRRLGFEKCIIPRSGSERIHCPEGLQLLRVRNIREAIEIALDDPKQP
jgi:hypothetical protein